MGVPIVVVKAEDADAKDDTVANCPNRNTLRTARTTIPRRKHRRPDGYVPIILPGESLAKYKAPSSSASVAPPESAPPLTPASFPPEPTRESLSPAPPPEPARPEYPAASYSSPAHSSASSAAGFEPLPGESIAKWKNRETPVEHPTESRSTESHSDDQPGYAAHESFCRPRILFCARQRRNRNRSFRTRGGISAHFGTR